MRYIPQKNDVIDTTKIPFSIGRRQPFENASEFYLLKHTIEKDCYSAVVLGEVQMSARCGDIWVSVQPKRNKADEDIIKYFNKIQNWYISLHFDGCTLEPIPRPIEDPDYKPHPELSSLMIVPKLWLEFWYKIGE